MKTKVATLQFEGVNFDKAWMRTKSEAEFVEHEKHGALSEDQLREAYALAMPKVSEAVKGSDVGDDPIKESSMKAVKVK